MCRPVSSCLVNTRAAASIPSERLVREIKSDGIVSDGIVSDGIVSDRTAFGGIRARRQTILRALIDNPPRL